MIRPYSFILTILISYKVSSNSLPFDQSTKQNPSLTSEVVNENYTKTQDSAGARIPTRGRYNYIPRAQPFTNSHSAHLTLLHNNKVTPKHLVMYVCTSGLIRISFRNDALIYLAQQRPNCSYVGSRLQKHPRGGGEIETLPAHTHTHT